jgi:multiple sugar transport system substrate-binding protein
VARYPIDDRRISRRRFIELGSAAALVAAGCGGGDDGGGGGGTEATKGGAPATSFKEPSKKLSGDLRILMWSHFVPSHDEWFDPFAKDWGKRVGVNVSVDHIDTAAVPARISSEISAGQGHDLIQHIAPLPQFEPSVVDMRDVTEEAVKRYGEQLKICERSSLNPTTKVFYAYSPGWVPDPGDYRTSMWEKAGFPNGPATWDDLLQGGAKIKQDQGVQLGIGMSQEIDSNMAARAIMYSFGASEQDENENVTLNSDATVAAVEFMKRLYEQAMTDEVFAWNAASNNQGLISGELSYILNSISGFRTAQDANPDVANDTQFVSALKGPKAKLVCSHVMYNWIVPKFSKGVDAAKEFLLHYTENFAQATDHSKLYDFPAFADRVPKLDQWLDKDPYGGKPPDLLAVLKDATDWSTNVGHPGPSSTAIGEAFGTFIVPNMFARAARGQRTPQQAVADADAQMKRIFEKWKRRGLIGGGST